MTLAEFMEAEGLTQAQVAERVGVTQPTISRVLEKGVASVEVAIGLERMTSGKVSAEKLNAQVRAIRAAA